MNILLLEDDRLVARSLLRVLKILGHEVVHVESNAAGVEVLESREIGALIADLGLSHGESGATLVAWVRENRPEIRRILMSGVNPPSTYRESPPMEVFLAKPFDPADLTRLLEA